MTRKVTASEAKAQLSALIAEVAYGGERFVIEKRGKPVAALISVEDLKTLGPEPRISGKPRGPLALIGMWKDLGDDKIDEMVSDIYSQRENDKGRKVELGE